MNKLLERILDIIANDAFPDEDKPYIIKEVIDTYNDNSKLCYPAGSRVELGWGDGYDCGYNQAKHDIGTSQQREPDERYDKGFEEGKAWCEAQLEAMTIKYGDAKSDLSNSDRRLGAIQKNYMELEQRCYEAETQYRTCYDEAYNKGHAEGYQKGLDEKAMQHVTDIFTVRKTSKEEGYQAGYRSCKNEVVSAVVNTINNLKHTTGGIPK